MLALRKPVLKEVITKTFCADMKPVIQPQDKRISNLSSSRHATTEFGSLRNNLTETTAICPASTLATRAQHHQSFHPQLFVCQVTRCLGGLWTKGCRRLVRFLSEKSWTRLLQGTIVPRYTSNSVLFGSQVMLWSSWAYLSKGTGNWRVYTALSLDRL